MQVQTMKKLFFILILAYSTLINYVLAYENSSKIGCKRACNKRWKQYLKDKKTFVL